MKKVVEPWNRLPREVIESKLLSLWGISMKSVNKSDFFSGHALFSISDSFFKHLEHHFDAHKFVTIREKVIYHYLEISLSISVW